MDLEEVGIEFEALEEIFSAQKMGGAFSRIFFIKSNMLFSLVKALKDIINFRIRVRMGVVFCWLLVQGCFLLCGKIHELLLKADSHLFNSLLKKLLSATNSNFFSSLSSRTAAKARDRVRDVYFRMSIVKFGWTQLFCWPFPFVHAGRALLWSNIRDLPFWFYRTLLFDLCSFLLPKGLYCLLLVFLKILMRASFSFIDP